MSEWWDAPRRGRSRRWPRRLAAGLAATVGTLAAGLVLWLAWAVL